MIDCGAERFHRKRDPFDYLLHHESLPWRVIFRSDSSARHPRKKCQVTAVLVLLVDLDKELRIPHQKLSMNERIHTIIIQQICLMRTHAAGKLLTSR